MKKSIFKLTVFVAAIALFTGCVAKQKYNELLLKQQRCQEELTYMTSENQSCQDAKKALNAQVNSLTAEVEQLRADTMRLYRQAKNVEREYDKAKKDYDDLLQNFADL